MLLTTKAASLVGFKRRTSVTIGRYTSDFNSPIIYDVMSRANFRPDASATVALENCRQWTWISQSGPQDGSDESSGSDTSLSLEFTMGPLKWVMLDSFLSRGNEEKDSRLFLPLECYSSDLGLVFPHRDLFQLPTAYSLLPLFIRRIWNLSCFISNNFSYVDTDKVQFYLTSSVSR